MEEKKPSDGVPKVPTTRPRSRNLLNSSHDVSGTSTQLWHAARLQESGPCPPLAPSSMQTGSDEHHWAFRMARKTAGSKYPGLPMRTNPPMVPSASPAAV